MQFSLIFILATIVFDSKSSEQLAFNYFMKEIYADNYNNEKSAYFSRTSKAQRNIAGPFTSCFTSDELFSKILGTFNPEESDKVIIEKGSWPGMKFTEKPRSKCLKIEIYRSVRIGDFDYVYISVYKPKEFVDHFLIKIGDQKIVEYCRINEVI